MQRPVIPGYENYPVYASLCIFFCSSHNAPQLSETEKWHPFKKKRPKIRIIESLAGWLFIHRAQRYSRQHSLCPCCGRTFDGRGNRKGSVEGGRFVILEREYTTFWSNMICFQILLYARIRNKPSFSSPWIYFKCMYKDAITTKIDGTPRNTLVILCNGEYLPYFFSPFTSGFFSLNFSFSISPISLRSLPCFSIILMAL